MNNIDDNPCLIGQSKEIQQIREILPILSRQDVNILIQGESGTGKDIIASLIGNRHNSCRSNVFVKINCPAVPESLLESELFGHEAGAFTGALRRKPGRLEIANHGTLFLDEIGEIPLSFQSKLLEFIESKQVCRVGGISSIHVNARIISATNAPLDRMIRAKTFREDLYYRLNEFSIHIPPLRNRRQDIPLLVEHFMQCLSGYLGIDPKPISDNAINRMVQYDWPGNVRELKSVVKHYLFNGSEQRILEALAQPLSPPLQKGIKEELHLTEKNEIIKALLQNHWNQRKTASVLGISYSSLRRKITKYSIGSFETGRHHRADNSLL